MADEELLAKVHNLSDLELAFLLSLINREHCLISTPPDALDDLVGELQLISSRTFGLRCVTINCHTHTTLQDFVSGLLVPRAIPSPPVRPGSTSPVGRTANDSYFLSHTANNASPVLRGGGGSWAKSHAGPRSPITPSSSSQGAGTIPAPGTIANVVLARDLDRAPPAVQAQALELLRTRRVFTRTAVQAAPKPFLLVAVLGAESGGRARVGPHLNDLFCMAHWHDPDDGFANLGEVAGAEEEDTAGLNGGPLGGGGMELPRAAFGLQPEEPLFSDSDLSYLAKSIQDVQVDIDVVRYQMNIVSFLRIHRAVASGVTPTATKHLERLTKCLAPLHRLDYVTPSLVAMAVKKVYLHRLQMVEPPAERSMQWGSDLAAVEAVLENIGPEDVIEDVLAMVTAPV